MPTAQKAFEKFVFRPIRDDRGEEQSIGWTNPMNLLAEEVKLTDLLMGEYLYLGLRMDRKSPNRAMLKAMTEASISERLSSGNRKRLSQDEKRQIQADMKNRLLKETSASTKVVEALWNLEGGWLYFGSQSTKDNDNFLDFFADTFGLETIPMLPYTYAEAWAENEKLLDELEDLTEANFAPRAVPSGKNLESPFDEREDG